MNMIMQSLWLAAVDPPVAHLEEGSSQTTAARCWVKRLYFKAQLPG